jgi:spore coat polysaccharide biosynthesis protein SpsF
MGSSRLPGKALLPVLGRPMLARMIERIRCSRRVGRIVLTTTTTPADDPIEALADELANQDVHCYRGPAEDVLGRVVGALRAHPCTTALQLLGDNPLIHSDQIDAVCERHEKGGLDYVVTAAPELPKMPPGLSCFPTGLRVEALSPELLERCARMTDEPYHREHSTSFIQQNAERFGVDWVEAPSDLDFSAVPGLSLAVNYRQDYERIRRVFELLYPEDPNFSLSAVASLVAAGRVAAQAGAPTPAQIQDGS